MRPHHERRSAGAMRLEPLESRTLLAATKIMPLGDSITEGYQNGHNTYRLWLWQQLTTAGYDVDFVGSKTGVGTFPPTNPNFDQNHEGHAGWTTDQLQANIAGWANTYQPQIVLLHIGTNDIHLGQSNSSTINEIGGIIDNLRNVVPSVKVLLTQIIPNNFNATATQQLNGMIATLAGQKNLAQSPVVLVDQHTGFSVSQDTWDGIHPDDSGEQKMAGKWYNALVNVLPPVFYASSSAFVLDAPAQSVTMTFNHDVSVPSLSPGDLVLKNLTTNQPIDTTAATVSYNGTTRTATWAFATRLADGYYRAQLPAGAVSDTANRTVAAFETNFFALVGDADSDHAVTVTDLGILASNWQKTNAMWSEGDFNYDGRVTISDLGDLASNWQKTVSPTTPMTLAAVTTRRMVAPQQPISRPTPVAATPRTRLIRQIDTPVSSPVA